MAACGHCGTGLRDGARFCGTCGRPVTATPLGKQPTGKVVVPPIVPTAPLSPPPPPPPAPRSTALMAGLVVGVLVVGVLALVAVLLTQEDDDPVEFETAGAEEEPDSPPDTQGESAPGPDDSVEPPEVEVPVPDTVAPSPDPSGLPPGEWAALLYAAEAFGPADAERGALAHFGNVQVLASSDYTTLRPGLYVVYVGGFEQASGALDFCRATGRTTRDLCYARYLSRDPSVTWNIPGTDEPRPEFLAYP